MGQTVEVRGPNGKLYEFRVPPGGSIDDVLRQAQDVIRRDIQSSAKLGAQFRPPRSSGRQTTDQASASGPTSNPLLEQARSLARPASGTPRPSQVAPTPSLKEIIDQARRVPAVPIGSPEFLKHFELHPKKGETLEEYKARLKQIKRDALVAELNARAAEGEAARAKLGPGQARYAVLEKLGLLSLVPGVDAALNLLVLLDPESRGEERLGAIGNLAVEGLLTYGGVAAGKAIKRTAAKHQGWSGIPGALDELSAEVAAQKTAAGAKTTGKSVTRPSGAASPAKAPTGKGAAPKPPPPAEGVKEPDIRIEEYVHRTRKNPTGRIAYKLVGKDLEPGTIPPEGQTLAQAEQSLARQVALYHERQAALDAHNRMSQAITLETGVTPVGESSAKVTREYGLSDSFYYTVGSDFKIRVSSHPAVSEGPGPPKILDLTHKELRSSSIDDLRAKIRNAIDAYPGFAAKYAKPSPPAGDVVGAAKPASKTRAGKGGKPLDIEEPKAIPTGPKGAADWQDWALTTRKAVIERMAERGKQAAKTGIKQSKTRGARAKFTRADFERLDDNAKDAILIGMTYLVEHGGKVSEAAARLVREGGVPLNAAKQYVTHAADLLEGQGWTSPVKKATEVIRAATRVRAETDELAAAHRAKQAARLGKLQAQRAGFDTMAQEAAALKGPFPKAAFSPVWDKFDPQELKALANIINAADLAPQAKYGLKDSLERMLKFGELPGNYELDKFRQLFGDDFVKAIIDKRDLWGKTKGVLSDLVMAVPRTIETALDFGQVGRQGIAELFADPFNALKGAKEGARGLSELAADVIDLDLRAKKFAGKTFEEWGGKLESLRGGPGDEFYPSHFLGKAPGIKQSRQVYATNINSIRVGKFEKQVAWMERHGLATPENLQDLADFVTKWTGRGNLGVGDYSRAAGFLSKIAYAPRYFLSKPQAILKMFTAKPGVRRLAAQDTAKWLIGTVGILKIAESMGAEVNWDPRSTDFLKVKIGNTRIDMTGGMGRFIGTVYVLGPWNDSRITSKGEELVFGEGYKPETKLDVAERFLQGKASPAASLAFDLLRGKTYVGEPVTLGGEAWDKLVPLVIQDFKDAIDDELVVSGYDFNAFAKGAAKAAPAFFGFGATTYDPFAPKPAKETHAARGIR